MKARIAIETISNIIEWGSIAAARCVGKDSRRDASVQASRVHKQKCLMPVRSTNCWHVCSDYDIICYSHRGRWDKHLTK